MYQFKDDLLEGLGFREESSESQESDEFEATPKQLPKKENSAENQVDGNSSEQLGGTESQESEEVESISRPMIRHPTRKKKKKKENSAENQVDENSSEQLFRHPTRKKFKNFRMELDCESDNDCRRNEFCAVDIGKCLKQKNLEFKERCTRNGGNFDVS